MKKEKQEKQYNTRTLRLQVFLTGETPEERSNIRKRVKQISDDALEAANIAVRAQYLNKYLIDTIYTRNNFKKTEPDDRKQVLEKFKEFFGVLPQATGERDMKINFPNLPSCVSNCMNQITFKNFNSDAFHVFTTRERYIRTYKKGMPVDIATASFKFESHPDEDNIIWSLSKNEKIKFEIYYGKDRGNYKSTIKKIINNEIKQSASKIQVKDGKIFFLLIVREEIQGISLDPDICAGIDLGLKYPAYIHLDKGEPRKAIGNEFELTKHRTQIANRKRAIQKSSISARSQHGRNRKMKSEKILRTKERDFVKNYNHNISKHVIDFCLKYNAGTIKMELLEGIAQEEKKKFILRNWSYFELQYMIQYKAKSAGINVLFVDPYMTSLTCSKCGKIGERPIQAVFKCTNDKCDVDTLNGDENAARNIAISNKIVTEKSECEYHKRKKINEEIRFLTRAIKNKKEPDNHQVFETKIKGYNKYLIKVDDFKKAKNVCALYINVLTAIEKDEAWKAYKTFITDANKKFSYVLQSSKFEKFKERNEKLYETWHGSMPNGEGILSTH